MIKKKAPEQHNDFEDAFIREIDEELKNEKVKKIWDKYGLFIILFVVIAVFSAVSFESFKAWQDKRHQEMSDTFAYALNLQNQGRFAEAQEVLTSLKNANHGIYTDIAQMQLANLALGQKQIDKAMEILEQIANNDEFNPQMKDIAILKLASYKLNNAPQEDIKALLSPLVNENSVWNNSAKELLAMLAIREKDFSEAKKLYTEISDSSEASDSLKTRAHDMINVLSAK